MIGKTIVLACLIAFLNAETRTHHNFNQVHQQHTSENSNEFAQERQGVIDSYGAPTAPLVQPEPVSNTQTYSQYPTYSDGSVTYDAPVTFPQQTVQYQPGPVSYQNPGVNCPTGLASFGGNFLTTAIQVILGLFTFSLLLSLLTKFAGASFLSDIFEERSFNPDTVQMYTELALNGIEKAKSLYEDVLNKE